VTRAGDTDIILILILNRKPKPASFQLQRIQNFLSLHPIFNAVFFFFDAMRLGLGLEVVIFCVIKFGILIFLGLFGRICQLGPLTVPVWVGPRWTIESIFKLSFWG
jgi:hypothetical protein